MRLGILELGPETAVATLIEALRAQDIDLILPEETLTSGAIAAREAARLGRADCDAVAIVIGETAAPALVGSIALHLTCPLLLVGRLTPALFDASGALAEIGVPFDRLFLEPDSDLSTTLVTWLTAHRKSERQPGIEAVSKLYGLRLSLGRPASHPLDAAQWQQQFGITVVAEDATAEIQAPDGDAYTALCAQLLRLLTNAEPTVLTVDMPFPAEHTFVQIARRAGRVIGLYGYMATVPDVTTLPLLGGKVIVVPGDKRVALRAACHALDIAV